MSAHRSPRLTVTLRALVALACLVTIALAMIVGSTIGTPGPAGAKATPTTARRATVTTVRKAPSTTARTSSTTSTVPTTTTVPANDVEQVAAAQGPPALLVSGPEVAAASSRRDLLLSPGAMWVATGALALTALVVGGLTTRYWRRTRPS